MGIGYYYANEDAREWFSPRALGDNDKRPVDRSAVVLFELLKDRWNGARIRVYADSGDLPWDLASTQTYGAGVMAALWKGITPDVQAFLDNDAWGYTYPAGDYQTAQYVNLRVCDDRGYPVPGGKHTELLARCVEAIKKVEPVP